MFFKKAGTLITLFSWVCLTMATSGHAQSREDQEFWEVNPQYEKYSPNVIAVLPMDNFSLEPELEDVLYSEVYQRLQAKGYRRVSVEAVQDVMDDLGIQTPGQLQGISLERLCSKLNTEAVLLGQVDQSASIHQGVYDAVVVSCSLRLTHCQTGQLLWRSEQWRTAHRQWQIDPFNAIINLMAHSSASRSDRIAWLVQEMLKTLPPGKITIQEDNLLQRAIQVQSATD
ncbi:GNA1162 family protein [Desulfonatronovibrio magnus]|uniref:GNA1162 family protein n=1 Tax=Desulfonatronovibrio magnus TaxID=698827 RepID=UPI0005EAE973|nr:GNA1162 family protein [Desulfonatronovibrio magnus]